MPELSRFFGIIIRMFVEECRPPVKIEPLRSSTTHPFHRVERFDIVGPYTLSVALTDGTTQEIDFRPVLHGALFGPLRLYGRYPARWVSAMLTHGHSVLKGDPGENRFTKEHLCIAISRHSALSPCSLPLPPRSATMARA